MSAVDFQPDFELVAGFRFRCRPGCGLCCYTTPAVAPDERPRLIQLDPSVPLRESADGWAQIESRPEGGACHFLQQARCGCHAIRPATCVEFPLTAHVGARVQVSVVLTCPGVDLSSLPTWASGKYLGPVLSDFRLEADSVRREVDRARTSGQLRAAFQRRRSVERRLRRDGIWQPEEEVRAALHGEIAGLSPAEGFDMEMPEADSAIESLPMFFDSSFGRVAWRPRPGGAEFLSIGETGGVERHLGLLAWPGGAAHLTPAAWTLLRAYLAYVLERDVTIDAAYRRLLENGDALPVEVVSEDIRSIARQVLTLAALRRALTSDRQGRLTPRDIENGIRATDMDLLDRPTTGLRL
jgi:Fe-S-cluster containining protein